MSRRPQSLRPPARPSVINTADIAQAADETMTIEDLLRRQVLDKDRENDRVRPITPRCQSFSTMAVILMKVCSPAQEQDFSTSGRAESAAR